MHVLSTLKRNSFINMFNWEKEAITLKTPHLSSLLPRGPWIMSQTWNDVLFAHWDVAEEWLRAHIPPALELDTYEGKAWISILPFHISKLRARFLPPIPGVQAFPELNLRTYVSYQGRPGIYFFSLDASHRLAVIGARMLFHLPYYHADMAFDKKEECVSFWSFRKGKEKAECKAVYQPISSPTLATPGSLDHWLTERYRLYTTFKEQLYYEDIYHEPWQLQEVEAQIPATGVATAHGFTLPERAPLLHYAKKQKVRFWPIRKWKR